MSFCFASQRKQQPRSEQNDRAKNRILSWAFKVLSGLRLKVDDDSSKRYYRGDDVKIADCARQELPTLKKKK